MNQYAKKEEQNAHQCCKLLKEENQRLREVLLYLAEERFCTSHMKVKIFSALNPNK